jgi:hypothetical protein
MEHAHGSEGLSLASCTLFVIFRIFIFDTRARYDQGHLVVNGI